MIKIILIILFLIPSIWLHAQQGKCRLLYKDAGVESAYPRWSRGKDTILFQSNRTGTWQLVYLDLATTQVIPITRDASNNNFPDWSADQQWIAFVSDRDGNEEIYLAKADGSGQRRLTNDPGRDIHPYFSPDGKYLLFNSTRGNGSLDIYRYTIATNATERLTATSDDETCARYSPDMKQVVYLKNGIQGDDLYVLTLKNFLSDNITRNPIMVDGWPMFSYDGKWIYFSSKETGKHCIYRIRPDGTEKQQITNAADGVEDARVAVSRDGKQILYNKRTEGTIEIHLCTLPN